MSLAPTHPFRTGGNDITSALTRPVWYDTKTDIPSFPKLDKNEQADVVIVGGGIGGLSAAYLLSKQGKKVVLVEDGELGSGETGRTTGHVFSYQDDRIYNIIKQHNEDTARLAVQSHAAAIDQIERIVKEEGIECNFLRVDGYLIPDLESTKEKNAVHEIQKEFEAVQKSGLVGATLCPRAPLPLAESGECIRIPNQAQFDVLKYIFGLAKAITNNGGKIFTHTHAKEIAGGKNTATIVSDDGFSVTADNLIVATNIPVNDRFSLHTKMEIMKSYVVGFKIAKGSVPKALVWDTSDPYNYARTVDGPSTGDFDYLIVGGQDADCGQHEEYEERFQKLINWTKTRYPVQELTHRWSGEVAEPMDSLAFLGKNPSDYDNVYIITADSGQGMTHCTIGGMMITDMILGRPNPWAKIYDPSRLMSSTITDFIKHNLQVQVQYTDYLKCNAVNDIEDIKPGCGGLLRHGLTDIEAVYKDENGKLNRMSAKCPHLGAIVHWNQLEKTWDCPCHGSRFDRDGTVVEGPANRNLTPSTHTGHK